MLGEKVKFYRKQAGITQLELELRINAAFGSISRIENGLTNPTKETLFAIAKALGLGPFETADLFGINLLTGFNALTPQQFDNIYPI